jgi:sulfite reductase beta subunit-like hemoprotein
VEGSLGPVLQKSRQPCGEAGVHLQRVHLAGACPYEVLDISPWAEAVYRHFVRNPLSQRLPRKFKFNFSGCATDCGQAMFNDVGIVAVSRPLPDGTVEPGFRVFVAGGLGANPHPAQALEEFTSREDLMATCEAILRVFGNFGNRDNKLRARMKWLVDTMGMEKLRERIFKERNLLVASSSWPGGVPEFVREHGDAPAGASTTVTPTAVGHGVPVSVRRGKSQGRWEDANVVRGVAKETVSAYAYAPLGDITSAQFRALASIQRELGADVRVTNRQNLVFRGLTEEQLPTLYARLDAIGMAEPGAELVRDVVACPGADTCNLAVTQSRGLADEIGRQLEEAGLADTPGLRINISGCTNSCGQHHISDIGFHGAERRAHGKAAPGYQMLLGGHVGDAEIEFGQRATRLPAKAAAEAAVRVVRRFTDERSAGETFNSWLERSGGAAGVGQTLKELDVFPTPEERPDFYVDYDETGPYVVELGQSECAT